MKHLTVVRGNSTMNHEQGRYLLHLDICNQDGKVGWYDARKDAFVPFPEDGGLLPITKKDFDRLHADRKRLLAPKGFIFADLATASKKTAWVRKTFIFANTGRWRPKNAQNLLNNVDPRYLRP